MTRDDAFRHQTLIQETDRRRPSAGRFTVWQEATRTSLCFAKSAIPWHHWIQLPLATAVMMGGVFWLSQASPGLALGLSGGLVTLMSLISWLLWRRHEAAPTLEEWITLRRTEPPTLEVHLTSLSVQISELECLALRKAATKGTGDDHSTRFHWFLYAKPQLGEFLPIHVESIATNSEKSFLSADFLGTVREFCALTQIPLMEPPTDREIVMPHL